jgi:small subunit ribosomal protein S7
MSRRHRAEKREIIPDAKYGDVVVTKFMNSVMYEGKKSTAEGIVYGALDIVESRARVSPVEVFKAALDNVAPAIEGPLPPRRRRDLPGSRSRFAPSAARLSPSVGSSRRPAAATTRRWSERLSAELLDASNNRGNAVKKREDTHRMAEANRAFSHYRW